VLSRRLRVWPVLVEMELLELAVDRGLALHVLAVQPFDEFMSGLLALIVRMVAVTEHELAAGRGMLPDPPAAWLVTVVLPHQLVDARADRAQDAELFDVRAEPGPEALPRSSKVA
jgi:hypothetical protein